MGLKLTRVASLSSPVALAQAPGDDTLYIAEKGGRVRAVRNGRSRDRARRLRPDHHRRRTGPARPGVLADARGDGRQLHGHLGRHARDEYPFSGGQVTGGARQLLFVDQPYANHNGGNVIFGPDGSLYVGMGDGGSGGDPQNHAQNPDDRLGKMLRIDAAAPTPRRDLDARAA